MIQLTHAQCDHTSGDCQVDPDDQQVLDQYQARATQLHQKDSPEANQAIDTLASALAGMELSGLHDDTHLINLVAHLLGCSEMPY